MLSQQNTKLTMTDPHSIRKIFYCPSNPDQNDNTMWSQWESLNQRSLGYNYLIKRGPKQTPMPGNALAGPPTVPVRSPIIKWTTEMTSSDQEVAFDDIISTPTITTFLNPMAGTNQNTTSHIKGKIPAGGNMLGGDGHVDFKKWDQTKACYVVSGDSFKIPQWIQDQN
jgi:hypothetical protein